MASSPMLVLVIIGASLAFMGLVFGAVVADQSFPEFEQPSGGGFFGALDAILAVVQGVWGVILFILNLLAFNVSGAPWWISLFIGLALGGGLVWSVATLFRGN